MTHSRRRSPITAQQVADAYAHLNAEYGRQVSGGLVSEYLKCEVSLVYKRTNEAIRAGLMKPITTPAHQFRRNSSRNNDIINRTVRWLDRNQIGTADMHLTERLAVFMECDPEHRVQKFMDYRAEIVALKQQIKKLERRVTQLIDDKKELMRDRFELRDHDRVYTSRPQSTQIDLDDEYEFEAEAVD